MNIYYTDPAERERLERRLDKAVQRIRDHMDSATERQIKAEREEFRRGLKEAMESVQRYVRDDTRWPNKPQVWCRLKLWWEGR